MGIETEPNIYEKPKEKESKKEKEQAPEEIMTILERALDKGSPVDLLILSSDGEIQTVPDLLVEEIYGDYLMMTYLNEKGETGEGIPLELSRVKGASLKVSSIEK